MDRQGGLNPEKKPVIREDEIVRLVKLTGLFSLSRIYDILDRSMGFAIAIEEATVEYVNYQCIRVRTFAGGAIRSFYVGHMEIPPETDTPRLLEILCKLFDAVFPMWKKKVIGISIEPDMNGSENGLQVLLDDLTGVGLPSFRTYLPSKIVSVHRSDDGVWMDWRASNAAH